MRASDDLDLAHTGPDTLGGRFLRRFWHPVYRAADLAAGLEKWGYPGPHKLWSIIILATELIGGPLLLLGLFTRPVAVAIFILLSLLLHAVGGIGASAYASFKASIAPPVKEKISVAVIEKKLPPPPPKVEEPKPEPPKPKPVPMKKIVQPKLPPPPPNLPPPPPDLPPSRLYLTYPNFFVAPFHYPNPVTGREAPPPNPAAGGLAPMEDYVGDERS